MTYHQPYTAISNALHAGLAVVVIVVDVGDGLESGASGHQSQGGHRPLTCAGRYGRKSTDGRESPFSGDEKCVVRREATVYSRVKRERDKMLC